MIFRIKCPWQFHFMFDALTVTFLAWKFFTFKFTGFSGVIANVARAKYFAAAYVAWVKIFISVVLAAP